MKYRYVILIGNSTYTVFASDIEEARYKVAKMLGVEMGELNKLKPQIFEQ